MSRELCAAGAECGGGRAVRRKRAGHRRYSEPSCTIGGAAHRSKGGKSCPHFGHSPQLPTHREGPKGRTRATPTRDRQRLQKRTPRPPPDRSFAPSGTIGYHPRWPAPKHVTVTQPGNRNQAVKERSSRSGHSAAKKGRAPSPRKQDTHQRVRDSTHAASKIDGGLSTTRRGGAWLPGDNCMELGERGGRDVRSQCNGRLSTGDWRWPHGNGRRGRREPARKETRMTKDGSLATADSRGPFVLETQKCGPHNCLLKFARAEKKLHQKRDEKAPT